MTKYKVGEKRVLEVEPGGEYHGEYRHAAVLNDERMFLYRFSPPGGNPIRIYLICNEYEKRNVGDLVVAKCVYVSETWNLWRELNDD